LPNTRSDPVTARGLSVDDGLTSDVGQDGAVQGRAHSLAGLGRFGLGALPWLLAFVVGTVVLHQSGTPALDIARYSAYWCLGVTLPGLLVARATVGTRGNWPEDVAMGAVTGLGLELLCFALWAILGRQQQLWLWPLLVVAIFVAVPRCAGTGGSNRRSHCHLCGRGAWPARSPPPFDRAPVCLRCSAAAWGRVLRQDVVGTCRSCMS